MQPFSYERVVDDASAIRGIATGHQAQDRNAPSPQFIAGGTTLLDLMKLGTISPSHLVDINDLEREHGKIEASGRDMRLGALARMSAVAEHADVLHRLPVIAQSLQLAASAQLRNMATLGGNVLQRTRCQYFRDPSWVACNKRNPGSGCAALAGVNRKHAVLGASDKCIATYPGDFGTALAALGAQVEFTGPRGKRTIAFDTLHLASDDSNAPAVETSLAPGELITAFLIVGEPWMRRSVYLKIRDRQSYEFALTSAAVALDVENGIVRDSRIGLGGVAYKPWRSHEGENALKGVRLDEATATNAAQAAFAGARARGENQFKIELGRRTLARAILAAGQLEI
jgi:xanthine dehydrogenase YagS FAD-binding subunit